MANKKITDLQLRSSVVDTLNFPSDDSIESYRVTAAQIFSYIRGQLPPYFLELANINLSSSVGSSALTIALKNQAGNNATAADPIRVSFRSSTLTSGNFNTRTVTGALSLVISSGSTLGQTSAQPSRMYIYLIDNAGTAELAVSHAKFSETGLVSTTAEGGAGAADSATVMYSTSARSNVPCRLIGYLDNTQTTAGTWASAGTQLQLMPFLAYKGPTQTVLTSGTAYNVPVGATRLRFRMVGGGGGGSGSGTGSSTGTTAGGDTTVNSTLLVAKGGAAGNINGNGAGAGGVAGTVGTGCVGFTQAGSPGGNPTSIATTCSGTGGKGGDSVFGGGGQNGGSTNATSGGTGAANSGSGGGGGGGGATSSSFGGGGGGSGGFTEAWIDCQSSAWASSFTYAIGAGGTGGGLAGGASNAIGGGGGAGKIIIDEYYD